jgi:hypothetical protein
MDKNTVSPSLEDFFENPADAQRFPLLYHFAEYYNALGNPYTEVENLNMVYSAFHQTPKHVVGFFYKHIANIDFDTSKIIALEKA